MCQDCGCGDPELVAVDVHEHLLAGNAATAAHNREHFRAAGVLALNLMGSPGAGKTALLEATARRLGQRRMVAVSGDLATARDADRLQAAGIPARAITTGSACHLDARLVHDSLHDLPEWSGADVFVIENVGNLVCPAVYDLGQDANIVAISVTEGDDKPLKYPLIFQRADLVVLTKIDLLPYLDGFDISGFREALSQVMPEPRLLAVSARTGEGVDEWLAWLDARMEALAASVAAAPAQGHGHGHHHHEHHEHHHDHEHDHRAGHVHEAPPGGSR